MKIGDTCFVHGYIDEIRKDVIIVRNHGGYFGTARDEVITGELVERKTGKWIHDGKAFAGGCDWMHCSVCGYKDIDVPNTRTNFCPNCGSYNGGSK